MNLKRPSMFTMLVILGAIVVISIIIVIVLNVSSDSDVALNEDDLERIDSIEGNSNIAVDSDGNKSNISNKLLTQKEVDGFVFDSFDVSTSSGVSTISFEIYNSNNEDKNLGEYELKVLDDHQNIIGRIVDNVGVIEGLSRVEVSLDLKGDIANLADIQITKVVYEEI